MYRCNYFSNVCYKHSIVCLTILNVIVLVTVFSYLRVNSVSSTPLSRKVKSTLKDAPIMEFASFTIRENVTDEPVHYETRVIKPIKYTIVKETSEAVLNSNFFNVSYISDFNSKYTIFPNNTCQTETFLLIIVPTVHRKFINRDAIRKTWASVAKGHKWPGSNVTINAKVFFVFGQSANPSNERKLRLESLVYGDILQSSFHESYANLPLKILMSLQFVRQFCPSVKYVLKADDDFFIDVDILVRFLKEVKPSHSVMGRILIRSPVIRTGKYRLSKQTYPLDVYPVYCNGVSYALSTDIIPCLMRYASSFPYCRLEDALITGFLSRRCNVSHIRLEGFHKKYPDPEDPEPLRGEIILYHVKNEEAIKLWKYMEDYYKRTATSVP